MSKGIQLKNISNIAQYVYMDDGLRLEMGPYAVMAWPQEQAELFLEKNPNVKRHIPIKLPSDGFSGKQIWVANQMGNPNLPPQVKIRDFDKAAGAFKVRLVENETRTPRVFKVNFPLGQTTGRDGEGKKIYLNRGSVPIEIPPHCRYPVPIELGQWLLQVCANKLPEMRNEIIVCREPTAFEPNDSWELDDILFYGEMVREGFSRHHALQTSTAFRQDVYGEFKEKIRALNILFFYLIDDKYTLPTKKAFEVYKRRLAADVEDAKIDQEIATKASASTTKKAKSLDLSAKKLSSET